jgi:hypothetical protein
MVRQISRPRYSHGDPVRSLSGIFTEEARRIADSKKKPGETGQTATEHSTATGASESAAAVA